MKALALSSVIAVGLLLAGPVLADNSAYNSKTTQNVTYAPATGGAFDGTYLSSKGGSGLSGPSNGGITDKRTLCSRHDQMDPATCSIHCGLAVNS
jgi:hypothetical protein